MAAQRRIWLIADDYGLSPAVSAAIRDLATRGRLSGTSVMVTAPGFDRAEARSLAETRVAIGLHTTLTAPFRPLTPDFAPTQDGAFLPLPTLMARAVSAGSTAKNRRREAAQVARSTPRSAGSRISSTAIST